MHDLTGFQRDILYVLANGEKYGLGLKNELEDYYSSEINHGRLYPNLDQLEEDSLIKKRALDKRTNGYSLTDEGQKALENRRNWEAQYLEDDDSKSDDVTEKDSDAVMADGGTMPSDEA